MPARYNVVARPNPQDDTAPPKYYPSFASSGRLTLRQLAQRIAQISTVSSVDTMAVLEALLTIIPEEIADGNIVELGDLGTFRLSIRTKGAETAEEVTSHNITQVRPLFSPGKQFKQQLQAVTFVKNGS